jgi:Flp pilus assembly protein TadB
MNIVALVTAALDAVAKFFSWRASENSRDKDKAETLQRSNDARESQQKQQREQQRQLDDSLKRGDRDHFGDDW